MKEPPYTKKEVAAITDLSYRNVQFYTEQDVVPKKADGRGKFREYWNRDIVTFAPAGELGSYGLTVSEIRTAVEPLKLIWNPAFGIDVEDKKLIDFLIKTNCRMIISRNRDKSRLYHVVIGNEKIGEYGYNWSMFYPGDGSPPIMHVMEMETGETISVVEQKKIEFDLDAVMKENSVSHIQINICMLLEDIKTRMP